MRITWLLEATDHIWGGVKVALEDANWLHDRGHHVTVVSRTAAPDWMPLRCAFLRVPDFRREHIPDSDVLIGTYWSTVPWALAAQKGMPVHYCQGYEGDHPDCAAIKDRIEAAYRLPGVQHITIAPHLTRRLQQQLGIEAREIVYAIDHDVHVLAPPRAPQGPLRVGLIGPYQVAWKDLATGLAACRLAHAAGQPIVLVRVTNTTPAPEERNLPFPVEWHERVPPAQMGAIYRSLDVFLGTSRGAEEGFFLPAIEAMAAGVPCVLTDIPCFRGYGGDGYALFVPPQDPAAMAEALVVAGRVGDVRASLREAGVRTAARYRQNAHGEQLEQALLACHRQSAPPVAATLPPGPRTLPGDTGDLHRLTATLVERLRTTAADLHRQGIHADATRFLAAACCLVPDDLELRRELGHQHYLAGDGAAAMQIWEELQARGLDDGDLHLNRGMLLHALGRHDDAAQAFRAALAAGARSADTYNSLGVALYRAGDLGGARHAFERALALQPQHPDATANLQSLAA
ncbi:MAG: glycosyltransferase [Planctomycetes bacterium]|nr:glycosyltransferase [Planctomycetota bacterium]